MNHKMKGITTRRKEPKTFVDGKVTTPVKKSSTVLVKKEIKVTSKASAKTTKKKVIDSEDDDDDDDFVLNKLGNKIKVSS
ncbi:hypothetical protein M5K25_017425 [Dendrobium thyrsiflorum]|uniref:Uncharacterized protein n=1 Tax=Dendrobium thyrsiflorum TaxID=117978 RepID=A0ABD0UUG7_DENTH